MKRPMLLALCGLLVVAAFAALGISWLITPPPLSSFDGRALPDGWAQTAWPMLKDQFEAGLAFDCADERCGAPMRVTVRPKIGFCNCVTGVADDEELDRVGDRELVAEDFAPRTSGREIVVTDLKGRTRAFFSPLQDRAVVSIAYNNSCDVVVATAAGPSEEIEGHAIALLSSLPVRRWVDERLRR